MSASAAAAAAAINDVTLCPCKYRSAMALPALMSFHSCWPVCTLGDHTTPPLRSVSNYPYCTACLLFSLWSKAVIRKHSEEVC